MRNSCLKFSLVTERARFAHVLSKAENSFLPSNRTCAFRARSVKGGNYPQCILVACSAPKTLSRSPESMFSTCCEFYDFLTTSHILANMALEKAHLHTTKHFLTC